MFHMDVKNKIIQSQKKIMDALVECESHIGQLYEKYAERFPEMRVQWSELACAEKVHANLLQTMHRILEKGSIFRNLGKFSDQAIQPMLELIEDSLKKADSPDLTQKEAVAIALKIESSLLDSHFYDVVASDAPEFKIIAERLSADTRKHVDLIRRHFEEKCKRDIQRFETDNPCTGS